MHRFMENTILQLMTSWKLDLMYIQNYSILLDLRLILMTVKIMFIKDSTEGFEEIKPSEKKKD